MLESVSEECHKRGKTVLQFVNVTSKVANSIAYVLPTATILTAVKSFHMFYFIYTSYIIIYIYLVLVPRWKKSPWRKFCKYKKLLLRVLAYSLY